MARITHIHSHRRERPRLPDDWPTARDHLDAELDLLDKDRAEIGSIRVAVDRNTYVVAGLTAIAMVVLSSFLWLMTRQVDRVLAVAPITTQERVAAIADVLGDVPNTPGLRLQSGPYRGAPTVAAIQGRLRTVPGITARERNAACDSVPTLCQP